MSFKNHIHSMIDASMLLQAEGTIPDGVPADIDYFFSEMTNDCPIINYDLYDDKSSLKQHSLTTWICTDTEVGLYYYTLCGKPVAIAYQSARKNDKCLYFFNRECYDAVLAHIKQFILDDVPDWFFLDEKVSQSIWEKCPRIEKDKSDRWNHGFDIRNFMVGEE